MKQVKEMEEDKQKRVNMETNKANTKSKSTKSLAIARAYPSGLRLPETVDTLNK